MATTMSRRQDHGPHNDVKEKNVWKGYKLYNYLGMIYPLPNSISVCNVISCNELKKCDNNQELVI